MKKALIGSFFLVLVALCFGQYNSKLLKDVTLPDGTIVKPGSKHKKVWRLVNTGTVSWKGLFLKRTDMAGIKSKELTPLPDVKPGKIADVSVDLTMPSSPGRYFAHFKMVDGKGKIIMPHKDAIFVEVEVK